MTEVKDYGVICDHGSLKRKCQICDLEEEVKEQAEEIKKLRKERWELEKGIAEIHGQMSEALRCLEWYADEIIWIQGRYEGGVFFSRAEDDKGSRALKMIEKYAELY